MKRILTLSAIALSASSIFGVSAYACGGSRAAAPTWVEKEAYRGNVANLDAIKGKTLTCASNGKEFESMISTEAVTRCGDYKATITMNGTKSDVADVKLGNEEYVVSLKGQSTTVECVVKGQ